MSVECSICLKCGEIVYDDEDDVCGCSNDFPYTTEDLKVQHGGDYICTICGGYISRDGCCECEDKVDPNNFMIEPVDPYEKLGKEVGRLVAEKQKQYGRSFQKAGECLKQMFPDGIRPEQYENLLCITRILDKLFRIATDPNGGSESPFFDITGYALLGLENFNKKNLK